jgi:hypothetical protein
MTAVLEIPAWAKSFLDLLASAFQTERIPCL